MKKCVQFPAKFSMSSLIVLSIALPACSNEMGGGTALTSQDDGSKTVSKSDQPSDPTVNKSGESDDKNTTQNGDERNISDQTGDETDKNRVDDPALSSLIECLKKKAFNYNVAIVLDNSLSQRNTDPNRVRNIVSKDFVARFNKLVSRKPDTAVNISVVQFSGTAKRATPSWIRMDGKDVDANVSEPIDNLRKAIDLATEKESGGTNFGPAFKAASNLLEELGPSRLEANTKNYVLFMTDGEPTDSYPVTDISNSIVGQHNAAILAVASGSGIKAAGERKVQALALPTEGTHKGGYYRAATPEALKDTWEKLFVDLVACK
jgi:hypothetical protein